MNKETNPDFKVEMVRYVKADGKGDHVMTARVVVDKVQEMNLNVYDEKGDLVSMDVWKVNIPVEMFRKHMAKDMGYMEQ